MYISLAWHLHNIENFIVALEKLIVFCTHRVLSSLLEMLFSVLGSAAEVDNDEVKNSFMWFIKSCFISKPNTWIVIVDL